MPLVLLLASLHPIILPDILFTQLIFTVYEESFFKAKVNFSLALISLQVDS